MYDSKTFFKKTKENKFIPELQWCWNEKEKETQLIELSKITKITTNETNNNGKPVIVSENRFVTVSEI